jgi:hypothetical protein
VAAGGAGVVTRALAAISLLLAVPALAACGGGTSSKSTTPVADAVAETVKAPSEKVAITGRSTTVGQTLAFSGDGGYDHATDEGWLQLTLKVGSGKTSMDEAFVKQVFWIKSPLFDDTLPKGKKWLQVDLRKAGRNLGFNFKAFLGQTPGDALTQLGRTVDTPTELGTETIDGVETTHYRAPIDPKKVPRNDRLQKLTAAVYKPLEVWIDEDEHVRQVRLDFTAKSDPAKPQRGRTVVTMRLSDFGQTVDVEPPPASLVVDATDTVGG